MAYDRYEVEHHLTPAGWVTGTVTDSGNQETIVEPPTDRVETWLYKMEQSSGWSRESPALGAYLEASEHVIGGTASTEGFIHSARKRIPFTWTDASFYSGTGVERSHFDSVITSNPSPRDHPTPPASVFSFTQPPSSTRRVAISSFLRCPDFKPPNSPSSNPSRVGL